MEKKRSWSGPACGEEDKHKNKSPRKESNDKEDTEQTGPSTQDAQTQTTQENSAQSIGFLDVICGNKNGVLDKQKLERGEKCIKCDGCWYTPSEFEDFGGRHSSRKWKQSILHKNEPLQMLFDRGVLTTKGYKRIQSAPKKQKKIQSSSNKIISLDSSSEEIQTSEESDEEAGIDEDWLPSSGDLGLEAEEERVEAENDREALDSNVDTSKEEDEMEEGEMEDEDVPSGGASDSSVSEEREPKGIVLSPEKSALQSDVKGVIIKLTEATTGCQYNHKEPPPEDVGPATKSQRVLDECKYQNRDASTSYQQAVDLQVIQLDTRIPQTTQASNVPQSFNMVEAPSYQPSTSCDLDTMDLDQLRREKLKMQIKVLRLQEEHYTLKIKGHNY